MRSRKKIIFLCHRHGLSRAGSAKYILNDLCQYFSEKNIETHCLITKSKNKQAFDFSPCQITFRESFISKNISKTKVNETIYSSIAAGLMSDYNFILLFERGNPFRKSKGLFGQVHIIEKLVYNICNFIESQKPNYVFSFALPHHFINYAFVRIAEMLGIPVFFCDFGAFPWQYHLYHGFIDRKKIKNTIQLKSTEAKAKDWYNSQRAEYSVSTKLYQESGGLGVLHNKKNRFERLILLYSLFRDNGRSGYSFAKNIKSVVKAQIVRFYSNKLKSVLEKKLSVDITTFPYVIFFMHFQPEATSMPNGGLYAYQLFAIRRLSLSVPQGWKVLVREHPFTFENSFSPRFRNKQFYDAIEEMDNVQLLSLEHKPYDLIDNSKVVSTLTGSVGLQALCRERPVVAFGYSGYDRVYGVVKPQSDCDLKQFLNEVHLGLKTLDPEKVLTSLIEIEKEGFGYFRQNENPYAEQSRERGLNMALKFWVEEYLN